MIKPAIHNPRAFLLEPTQLDCSQASRFGTITYVFAPDAQRSSIWSPAFKREIVLLLEGHGFDPKHDKIIVAGHMVPLAIALTTIGAAFGPFNALMYSTVERDYILRQLGD